MDPDLADLTQAIRACRICVERPWGAPMPHQPNPILVSSSKARVLLASQAPGTRAHLSGVPFNDASGDRLRGWLGVGRDEFYDPDRFTIAPMGFCFPGQDKAGGDLPPRRECAPTWRAPLLDLMPQIELVLTIGMYAQAWHMPGNRRSLTETVADWRAILGASTSPRVLPLPHPSWRNTGWLKRNPWFEADVLPELKSLIRSYRPVPDTGGDGSDASF